MQICCKPGSLEDQDPKSKISKINFASCIRSFCRHLFHPVFWRIRIPKLNLVLVPRSCEYAVKQVVWRIRITKLNLDSVPKSCKKHSKLGSLEDQGPKSKISKINFASWIRSFWRHLCHPFFWRIRIRKLTLDLVPRSCKYAVKQLVWRIRIRKLNLDLVPRSCKYTVNKVVWRIRIPKLNLDLVPKSRKNTQNQVVWRVRVRKVRFPKLILTSWIRGFCRHLYTFVSSTFFWRIRIRKLNLDLVPRSCKYAVKQLVWRIRIRKLNQI